MADYKTPQSTHLGTIFVCVCGLGIDVKPDLPSNSNLVVSDR